MAHRIQSLSPAFRSTIGVILAVVSGFVPPLIDHNRTLTLWSYDLLYSLRILKPIAPASDIVLVYLDEASAEKLEQSKGERWDRRVHARLLDRLTLEGAKGAAFDIVFSSEGNPEEDKAFAESIRKSGGVILAAESGKVPGLPSGMQGVSVRAPLKTFGDAALEVAIAGVSPERDGAVRRHTSAYAQDMFSLFHLACVRRFSNLSRSAIEDATHRPAEIAGANTATGLEDWIRYYGPPFALPHVSYQQALSTNLPVGYFKNKIVFIGDGGRPQSTNDGRTGGAAIPQDSFPAPFFRGAGATNSRIQGTEILATLFLNVIEGTSLRFVSIRAYLAILFFSGVFIGATLPLLRPLASAGVSVAIIALLFAGVGSLAANHRWFPWLIVVVQVFAAYCWALVSHRKRNA